MSKKQKAAVESIGFWMFVIAISLVFFFTFSFLGDGNEPYVSTEHSKLAPLCDCPIHDCLVIEHFLGMHAIESQESDLITTHTICDTLIDSLMMGSTLALMIWLTVASSIKRKKDKVCQNKSDDDRREN